MNTMDGWVIYTRHIYLHNLKNSGKSMRSLSARLTLLLHPCTGHCKREGITVDRRGETYLIACLLIPSMHVNVLLHGFSIVHVTTFLYEIMYNLIN